MLLNIHKISLPINNAFFPPDYCDLYNLYCLAMKQEQNVILEVGSGYSTLVFSEVLDRVFNKKTLNRNCKVFSHFFLGTNFVPNDA